LCHNFEKWFDLQMFAKHGSEGPRKAKNFLSDYQQFTALSILSKICTFAIRRLLSN
jgi:hypothetical protein